MIKIQVFGNGQFSTDAFNFSAVSGEKPAVAIESEFRVRYSVDSLIRNKGDVDQILGSDFGYTKFGGHKFLSSGIIENYAGSRDGTKAFLVTGLKLDMANLFTDPEAEFAKSFKGNDIFEGGRKDDAFEGFDGNDIAHGRGGDDRINGDGGNDILDGGGGGDTMNAGSGKDHLYGGSGDDAIAGGKGSDVLEAGSGDDWVYGGSGSDIIDSGSGSDRIFGGGGNDTFRFTAPLPVGEKPDFIRDFSNSNGNDDRFELSLKVFNTLRNSFTVEGYLKASVFKAIDGAGEVAPGERIVYNIATGEIWFHDKPGNAGDVAYLFATVHEGTELTNKDFFHV